LYPERENQIVSPTSRAVGAEQSALGVGGCGREIFVLATCSSAALSLLQKEKKNFSDIQRGRVKITGLICTVASYISWRCTFGEFESLAVVPRRR
jgi:hypothetical protein